MRVIRVVVLVVIATTAVVLGTSATGTGLAPPAITHPARIPAFAGGTRATWASSNWSGYAETGHYSAISASWTVPSVSAGASAGGGNRFGRRGSTSAWYSATWTGIDGFNNSSLIQTGTEQDYYSGSAHYSAWWEILPAAETVISEPVSPGDPISANIVQTPTQVAVRSGRSSVIEYEWTITLTDTSVTHPWKFTTTQPYGGTGSSAEWVLEAPEVGGTVATLANYGFPAQSATDGDFNSAEVATVLGGPLTGGGLIYASDAGTLIQNGLQVSTPGSPDAAATAFNSLFGATVPSPPTS